MKISFNNINQLKNYKVFDISQQPIYNQKFNYKILNQDTVSFSSHIKPVNEAEKQASQLINQEPDILENYSCSKLLNEIKTYGIDEINRAINFLKRHNTNACQIPLSTIISTNIDQLFEAMNYEKKYKIPLDEAINLTYLNNHPKKTTENDIFPKNLNNKELKEKYKGKINWNEIVCDMYSQIRRTDNYAIDYGKNNFSGNYGDLYKIIRQNKNIITICQEYWTTRVPYKYSKYDNVKERISLNVKGDAELIKQLDKFMTKTNCSFVYKTYTNPYRWADREDPITIYFYDELTKDIYNQIAKITKPYARGRINEVDESSTTPWMIKEECAQGKMIDKLLERAKKLNMDLYDNLQKDISNNSLSTGQYRAYCKIMDEYEQYLKLI